MTLLQNNPYFCDNLKNACGIQKKKKKKKGGASIKNGQ